MTESEPETDESKEANRSKTKTKRLRNPVPRLRKEGRKKRGKHEIKKETSHAKSKPLRTLSQYMKDK